MLILTETNFKIVSQNIITIYPDLQQTIKCEVELNRNKLAKRIKIVVTSSCKVPMSNIQLKTV